VILILGALAAIAGPILLLGGALGLLATTMISLAPLAIPLIIPFLKILAVITAVSLAIGLLTDDFLAWQKGSGSILGLLLGDYKQFAEGVKNFFQNPLEELGFMLKGLLLTFQEFSMKAGDFLSGAFGKIFGTNENNVSMAGSAASIATSNNTVSSNNVNVKQNINVQMPEGTTEQQAKIFASQAKSEMDRQLSNTLVANERRE